ncbi:HNH endonuclease [Candidatus Pacearchaeota archaeon]|nr:HNH endonuclease [Candidatus Pacearchaeota archaeon]
MPNAPRTHKTKQTAPTHKKPALTKQQQHDKNISYGRRWKAARLAYLIEHPLCQDCLARGKTVPAQDVDHVTPLSQGGERLDSGNFRSLCRKCHNRKTHGRALMIRGISDD